jgi:hypothetical protein
MITCLNEGICVNGSCNCPEGYAGTDCGQQKEPSFIRITNIRVTRMPSTDHGENWDLNLGVESAPDIYVYIEHNGSKFYEHPSYIWNADPSQVYDFSPGPLHHIDMVHAEEDYTISLFDFDDWDPADLMGSIEFIPYADDNHFPQTIILDKGGDVAFELTVEYFFE